jgi:hypothetical protein
MVGVWGGAGRKMCRVQYTERCMLTCMNTVKVNSKAVLVGGCGDLEDPTLSRQLVQAWR